MAALYDATLFYKPLGPLLPFFDGEPSPDGVTALQFLGSVLMFLWLVLFVNRWNPVNGPVASLATAGISAKSALIGYGMDSGELKLRPWYVVSAVMALATLHLMFNHNPMMTSKMLAEKEAKR